MCCGQRQTKMAISIHAPRTGSDVFHLCKLGGVKLISIHAPRTGSDKPTATLWRALHRHFNPRSPHGERRGTGAPNSRSFLFQSTLPARGATADPDGKIYHVTFQSTLPARGATWTDYCHKLMWDYFNPRSPHGERLRKVTILSIRIIDFAQKVYHKTVLLRISLAENAVILPEKPRNPVRTSLQKAGGLRFARAIRAAHPYSISSPSGA